MHELTISIIESEYNRIVLQLVRIYIYILRNTSGLLSSPSDSNSMIYTQSNSDWIHDRQCVVGVNMLTAEQMWLNNWLIAKQN